MDKCQRKYLPAKADKFTLAKLEQLSEIAIPPHFHGSTSLSEVTAARRNFENSTVGDTFSELHDKYECCYNELPGKQVYSEQKPSDKKQVIPASQKRELAMLLERNSLEEYRRNAGLDKLREKLKDMIVEHASFENGLANLQEYVRRNPHRIPIHCIGEEEF